MTTGNEVKKLADSFEEKLDDYNSILVKAVGDRLAEALAEYMHRKVRREWGYGNEEDLSIEDMVREKYRGIRPPPGYPAQPDHTEKPLLFELLIQKDVLALNSRKVLLCRRQALFPECITLILNHAILQWERLTGTRLQTMRSEKKYQLQKLNAGLLRF
ncbi:MAG: hypothetical protein Ct9H300mP28_37710 [Pseudomonadota bacterium]|nr:MAG: hypothetical protein Ct9H300mP28_37710 [Pseudomonadota bacterium]